MLQHYITMENKALKNDRLDGKLMWELLPIEPIEEIVKILTYGAHKYAPNSWQKLDNGINRYYAALLRHLFAWRKGEVVDKESNINHLSHAITNLMFLLYLTNENNKKD